MGRGELYSVQPPDEDAIWQREVRLKGVAGDMAERMSPDMSIGAPNIFKYLF